MARRQADDTDANASLMDRRSYLKLASTVGAVATATFGGGLTASAQSASTSQVVDLGDEGLSQGDVIDPYLDDYFRNGNEVRIPEGEYDWNGGGLGNPSGDAALVGEGQVVLQMADDAFYNNIRATSGTIELRNVTVRGAVTGETRIRLEADSDAQVLVDNVNFPDGCVDDTGRGQAFYVPSEHEGLVQFTNCYIAKFSDNGIYASSSGKEGGGQVIIDRCVAHNNNISGFRIGGIESKVVNSVVLNDGRSPVPSGISHNQRGIRFDNSTYSQDMLVKNCDIIHSGDDLGYGGPIRWSPRAHDSSGHIENVRILNNVDIEAIGARRDATYNWTGNNIHVSGSGNLDVPDHFDNVTTGSAAQKPTSSVDDLLEGNGNSGDDRDWTEITFVTDESDGIEYSFTATGEVSPLYYRSEYNANQGTNGEKAEENDDGTWTGYGATSGASHSGDSFRYVGSVVDVTVSGDVDALTIYRDGVDVTQELLDASSDGSTDDSSTDDGSTDDSSTDDGSTDDGSTDDSSGETTTTHQLTVVTEPGDGVEYEFTTSHEIAPLYDASDYPADDGEAGEGAEQNDDGTWTGWGALSGASNSGDSFSYQGDVLRFDVTGDTDAITVYRDGDDVTEQALAAGEPTEHELTVVTEPGDGFEYEFTASHEITPLYDASEYPADDGEAGEGAEQNDDGTWSGWGALSGASNSGDSFSYRGDILSFDVTGDLEALTVLRDGEDVTEEALAASDSSGDDGTGDTDGASDLSNVLIVDGTVSDDVTTYQFAVTGAIERDDALSTMPADATEDDQIEDEVGDNTVSGRVGKGVDGYRYSGTIEDFQFSGKATLTIESASE